ncbi:hypothetical protein Nepgr_004262 [Nepenthes gracilis]|uniref:Rhodanese domain-containing protein n=1 Tax=Nepenthes gracilis TaxID=150966 RepID=A0AAD3S111_NEPGR|nr:hypothetical protein Nepgr_004262 [Nepenthes gracilis]
MESLSFWLSSSPRLRPHELTPKITQNPLPFNLRETHVHSGENTSQNLTPTNSLSSKTTLKSHMSLPLSVGVLSLPLPSFASEIAASAQQSSDKINIESILLSIDDFFNRNPFFVAGVTAIWLIVIPLTQSFLRKYKYISAIDAFRKLRDEPNAQLLDIRDEKSLAFLGSPNLKILNKDVVQVRFSESDDGFVKEVLEKFVDPQNTVVCILDNFDGNSFKVAELLFKNGFKEAYAIEGGVRGKEGWQEIQEDLLPPSVHIYRKKKVKKPQQHEVKGGVYQLSEGKINASASKTDPKDKTDEIDNSYYAGTEPASSPSTSKP